MTVLQSFVLSFGCLVSFSQSSSTLQFPVYSDVIPCANTAENCARSYYSIQRNLQTNIEEAYNEASEAQSDASTLLDSVTATDTGLKSIGDKLTDIIDPDNTRTTGGEIRVLTTGKKLVGLTPYMDTLSKRMVKAVGTRGTELKNQVGMLKTGMDQVTRTLQDTQTSANGQLLSIAQDIKGDITDQSIALRDYFQSLDLKMVSDASQSDTSAQSAPNATYNALGAALALEESDSNSTLTKLTDIQTRLAALPTQLDDYIRSLTDGLKKYQTSQEAVGAELASNKTALFNTELTQMTTKLEAKLRGIMADQRSDPYFNSSLPGYISVQRKGQDGQADSANKTQQARLNTLSDTVKQLSKSANSAFQPILANVKSKVARIVTADKQFQAAAQAVVTDSSATVDKTNASFAAFSKDLEGTWNLTGGILSGQTTEISADLLAKIGSMTQDAGGEVNKLDSIMMQASAGALASDAVRQAILANSRQQVLTAIGNNEAALNKSFATVKNFLNGSQSELSLIMDVLSTIAGGKQGQLNATATAAINGVNAQIAVVQSSVQNILANMTQQVAADIAADSTALRTLYSGITGATQLNVNQTLSLLQAMGATNADVLNRTNSDLEATRSLVNTAAATASALMSSVSAIPVETESRRKYESDKTAAIIANSTATLASTQNAIGAKFIAVKQLLEQAGQDLSTNQTAMIQAMSAILSGASASFDQSASGQLAGFDSLVSLLRAKVAVAETRIADTSRQLSETTAGVNSVYRDASGRISNAASASALAVQTNATGYAQAMKSDVTRALSLATSNSTGGAQAKLAGLTSRVTVAEGNVASLATSVRMLQDRPQELVQKAAQLQSQFATELNALRSSILTVSSDNDQRSDSFESLAQSVFGSAATAANGKAGLQYLLDQTGAEVDKAKSDANATLASGIGRIRALAATARNELGVKSTQFQASINQHQSAMNTTIDSYVADAFVHMNSSFDAFSRNIATRNASMLTAFQRGALMQSQLAALEASINQTNSEVIDLADADTSAALIAKYGADTAAQIEALMTSSRSQLSDAQEAAIRRQILAANSALDAADGLGDTGSALAAAVNAAIDSVSSVEGQVALNTQSVKDKLAAVVNGSSRTVEATSADVAAIVAQFSRNADASKNAVKAQLAAAGVANADVKTAMKIWENLKAKAMQLTSDELDNLVDTRTEVLTNVTGMVGNTKATAIADIDALKSSVDAIDQKLSITHDSDLGKLDSLIGQLETVANQAGAEKNTFDSSVSNLRGYMANMVNQLNTRYSSIVGAAASFRSAMETAAAHDIAGLTA